MFRVVVVGVRGDQLKHLRRRLAPQILVRAIDVSAVLRIRSLGVNFVLCTRFLGHKHVLHLESAVGCPVIQSFGGLCSWANASR